MDLITRVAATQQTIDQFYEQDFKWGERDCGVLAHQHLLNCGFPDTPYNQMRAYRTAKGCKRAMLRLGHSGTEDVIDSMGFERITPAAVLPGDLVAFPGGDEDGDEWLALGVAVDAGEHIIGFAQGQCLRGPVSVCVLAWRVA
jgi:hypothetical protein